MDGLTTVEARVWSGYLSREIVVKLDAVDAYMLCEDRHVDELKRLILSKAMDQIEEGLNIRLITMKKVL